MGSRTNNSRFCEASQRAKACQARLSPHAIGGEDDFCIGLSFEIGAGGFELFAEFAEVVDLAVEDDPIARDRILHGLVPER